MNPIHAVEGVQGTLDAVRALLAAQPPAQDESPMVVDGTAAAIAGQQPDARAAPLATPVATPLTEPPRVNVPADGRATMAQLAAGHTPHVASARAAASAAAASPGSPAQVSALANAAAAARALVSTAATPADGTQHHPGVLPESATLTSVARPTDSVALPVMITPLQTLAAHLQRPAHLPAERRSPSPPPLPREASRGADSAEGLSDPADADADHAPESDSSAAPADDEPGDERGDHTELRATAPDPDYTFLERWLGDAAQHDALRELAQRRRVLLIVPAPDAAPRGRPARVHLLVPRAPRRGEAHAFNARWWPGTGRRADWTAWRLHRDADAGGGPRLQSRHLWPMPAGAVTLLMRLGSVPPGLLDAGSACLDVPDLQRFGQHLGAQWRLLALLCPVAPRGPDSPTA